MNEVPQAGGTTSWQREITVAAAMLGFGLIVLPFVIYFVGQQVIGDYGEEAGALDLAEAIWSDLLALRSPAWALVLSPYVLVQLIRWLRRAWRRRSL